jgi:MerR family transcriptional regulator, redox-sensitive transcriptional activator SoxR
MHNMSIGRVARFTGLAPSAIRYYESAGLLPAPRRQSGKRRYSSEDLGRLRIIQLARAAGFTVAETRTFLTGFSATVPPAARWRSLAERKLAEIDVQLTRFAGMKALLESSFHCGCLALADCERAIMAAKIPSQIKRPATFP